MRVLFVCTGNTGRSAMAAGIFRKLTNNHSNMRVRMLRVGSAGIHAQSGEDPEKLAKEVMKEKQVSLDIHTATQVTQKLLEKYDLILTMETQHRETLLKDYNASPEKTFLLTEYVGETGDIADCHGHEKEVYVECADKLFHLVELLVKKFVEN
ncbi:MAG: low molecular weight protein arginine phosphatase [Candidatus Thorarchaeota archaeon]